jgi:hypothetical protein
LTQSGHLAMSAKKNPGSVVARPGQEEVQR